MSLMSEYINRKLSGPELEAELLKLISQYNQMRGTYLFVYTAAFTKRVPLLLLHQEDYYVIRDLLSKKQHLKKLDFYIETPGGSGETAEEIVRFLRSKAESISFIVSGEAKSAGTLIVLSGDEILMTETGSLGPVDAQIQIGRSVVSAYDYMEWVEKKRDEAGKTGRLNPFDATMVAQITPGELGSVYNALKFAEDLVIEWLVKYKFKNWTVTETRRVPVTDQMRTERAQAIAKELTNHAKWRLHGRSIKRVDLQNIGLQIKNIDDDPTLADLVYRIQTVCRFLFERTHIYKIFATQEYKIFKLATPVGATQILQPQMAQAEVATIEQQCPQCGKVHRIYAKFSPDPKIDEDFKKQGFTPLPKNAKIVCSCGFEIDLSGFKSQLEIQIGKKVIITK